MRSVEHVSESSGLIRHGSFIGALSPLALGNVFNPLEHEAERGRWGVPPVHTHRQFDTLILCIVSQGLCNTHYLGCSVK
jgi:hypothetical protein